MANATVDTITKTVEKKVFEDAVQLTLSKTEAAVMFALTAFVAGDDSTYRRDVRAVRAALASAGISVYWMDYFKVAFGISNIEALPRVEK